MSDFRRYCGKKWTIQLSFGRDRALLGINPDPTLLRIYQLPSTIWKCSLTFAISHAVIADLGSNGTEEGFFP